MKKHGTCKSGEILFDLQRDMVDPPNSKELMSPQGCKAFNFCYWYSYWCFKNWSNHFRNHVDIHIKVIDLVRNPLLNFNWLLYVKFETLPPPSEFEVREIFAEGSLDVILSNFRPVNDSKKKTCWHSWVPKKSAKHFIQVVQSDLVVSKLEVT